MKFFGLIILVITFFSCSNSSTICDNPGIGPNGETYKTEGCFINSLEEGTWKIYDSDQKLSQTGKYENGIRVGTWQYGHTNDKQVINWVKYENPRLEIITNIPKGLEIVEDSTIFIKFSNKDSNNQFNLIFIKHSIAEENIHVSEFHKIGESEILENGWKYQQTRTRLDLKHDTLYFNNYQIDDRQKGFSVLNMYKRYKDYLLEVACRYDVASESEAKRVFFSIVSNLFLEKNRFMDPFAKVNIVAL